MSFNNHMYHGIPPFFTEKGYRVFKADSGKAGLALYRHHEPDVVILDIRLPDTDGISLLEQIQ